MTTYHFSPEWNVFREAIGLLGRWAEWRADHAESEAREWVEHPVVRDASRFRLTEEELQTEYADVFAFFRLVREEALPHLETLDPVWIPLLNLRTERDAGPAQGLMMQALVLMTQDIDRIEDITHETFRRVCYDAVRIKAGYPEPEPANESPDLERLLIALSEMDMEDSERMRVIEMFREADRRSEQVRTLLTAFAHILEKHFPLVRERWLRVRNTLASDPKPMTHWLDQLLDASTKKNPRPEIFVDIGVVDLGRLDVRVRHEGNPVVLIGFLFTELYAAMRNEVREEEELQAQLKALADPTRWKMLKLTAKNEQYVQQLADALDLKPATVSHHLSQLHQAMLVTVRMEGRRTYIRINEKNVRALASGIEGLLSTGREA